MSFQRGSSRLYLLAFLFFNLFFGDLLINVFALLSLFLSALQFLCNKGYMQLSKFGDLFPCCLFQVVVMQLETTSSWLVDCSLFCIKVFVCDVFCNGTLVSLLFCKVFYNCLNKEFFLWACCIVYGFGLIFHTLIYFFVFIVLYQSKI